MSRPHHTTYFFKRCEDCERFEHRDTTGSVLLEWLVGDTIADAFCDPGGSLELVRMHRPCEDLVVMRRLSDIRATITKYY